MTRTESRKTKTTPTTAPAQEPAGRGRKDMRETVESIAVAFILALLIKGFEAEAFVIPTGSMAPTLMGRHKEVTCPQCGTVYAVNSSEEADLGEPDPDPDRERARQLAHMVDSGTCGNCRFRAKIDDLPSFKGDRILVMKPLWDLPFLPGASGPKRWDVVVFHYPEQPEQNYIKRLVGLPDEELRVHVGDILTRPRQGPPDRPFVLRRKPLIHQQAMQMLVYDDTHRPKALADRPEWQRWASPTSDWKEAAPGTFKLAGKDGEEWSQLRYRHLVPDPKQWQALADGQSSPSPPRRTLITDFYAYNSSLTAEGRRRGEGMREFHWVGDLTLEFDLHIDQDVPQGKSDGGNVQIELVRGGVPYRCVIALNRGLASLYQGEKLLSQWVPTGIDKRGDYHITFANVDGRLTLLVDGRAPFGEGVVYDDGGAPRPKPTAADLDPVGIAALGGVAVRVSGLVLKRDIYYTLNPGNSDYSGRWSLPYGDPDDPFARDVAMFDRLADASQFGSLGDLESRDFAIAPGRYMMMGDNSPRSKDGRGWGRDDRYVEDGINGSRGWDTTDRASWEVPESLLIGKAFFVYWPHGKPFGPDIRPWRDFQIPFRPYFERMKWIR